MTTPKEEFVFGANWAREVDTGEAGGKGGDADEEARQVAAMTAASAAESENEGMSMQELEKLGGSLDDSPLLDQGEVDSLLDKPAEPETVSKSGGLRLLVDSRHLTAERLPGLESIYERFARLVSVNLRYFTSENVDVNFGKLVPIRFGDYLKSVPWPSLLVVFKAEEWESRGLITFDNPLIYSVVDILHGGRRTSQMRYEEGKPYTVIETRLIERMIYIILSDLASSFDPITVVNFQYERMENDPRFVSIALPNNAAVIADFSIGIERRKGTMKIVMPYRTLEPIKSQLTQQLLGGSFGEYSAWTKHFSDSVRASHVEMEAVLAEFQTTLHEVFSWQKGSLLNIDVPLDPPITVRSGDTPLFEATVGRKEGHLALRLRRRAEIHEDERREQPHSELEAPDKEQPSPLPSPSPSPSMEASRKAAPDLSEEAQSSSDVGKVEDRP